MTRDPAVARVHSTCPHDCPSICALEVERIDDKTIGRIYGAKDNEYTAGVICAKVSRYAERVHHPDRLRTPLRRRGEKGEGIAAFEPLSWEDALDEVGERLLQAEQRHGAQAVWPHYFAGTMGLLQRDGIQRLRHVKKYSRQHSTICTTLPDAGWIAGVGAKWGVDPREMVDSDLIVVWGGNPVHTQVNVMHHIAQARRARGAKLVVVDPYRTATAEKADIHLMVRPGTDGALACGVMHILFRDGYADWDFLDSYTDDPKALEQHLKDRTPVWASEITGVPVAEIEAFATLYGQTERSYIRASHGFARSRNGAVNMHAVTCLPAITGAWRHRGGGALYGNAAIYGIDQTLIMGLDALDESVRLLDQSRIGQVLCGNPHDLQGGPPVTALFIQNTNPMVVAPESQKVKEGFSRDDLFACVHEQFMTETAAMADIVLPATTFLEHDDFYQGGGHTYLQVTRKVIEPFADARPNHWVLCEIAKRVGAKHAGFEMSAWELINASLARTGLPDADTIHDKHWHDCSLEFNKAHFTDGFAHPDGRFRFQPDWRGMGDKEGLLPRFPDHARLTEEATDEHPFRMVAAPSRNYLNTSFTETPSSQRYEKQPSVLMHPDDCAVLGLNDGDPVRLGNQRGSVVVALKSFEGVQPGVIVVESIWPNKAFNEGMGINVLIGAEPGLPWGGAAFHDTAVWARAA